MSRGIREESKLERWVVDGAQCIQHKLSNLASTGWPDRIFAWSPPRGHEYVEFKAEGEPLRPLQVYRCEELAKVGHKVFVIDNRFDGQRYIDGRMEPTFLPSKGD